MKTIKVTGRGRLKLRPDIIRLTLTLSGVESTYDAALGTSSNNTNRLAEAFQTVGFSREDLKTQTFSISTEYEGYEENGNWKQRFLGYRYLHVLQIEFDAHNALPGQALTALADCQVNAELQISYTVRDTEAAKNQLLGKAIADAGEKACVLAEAAGVTLKAIQSIDYGGGAYNFEVRPMDSLARPLAAKASYDLNIEPEDIDVSDTVTVTWEIES